jgi:hypothetical protein
MGIRFIHGSIRIDLTENHPMSVAGVARDGMNGLMIILIGMRSSCYWQVIASCWHLWRPTAAFLA